MAVRKEYWGTLPEVGVVYRYYISGEGSTEAVVTNLGAILLSLKTPDREGKLRDVVLGYDDLNACLQNPPHLGAVIGRNANSIGGASFTLNGKEYPLTKNDGENNLHSGNDFYRVRLWNAEPGENSVTFRLESPDGDQGFPGNAVILTEYTLTERGIRIHYHVTCDQDTVVNLTNHSYFQLDGHAAGDFSEQRVWIDADSYTPSDAALIPTGEIAPVAGTPLDFRRFRRIGLSIDEDFLPLVQAGGYDHNFVLNHQPSVFSLAARAESDASGIGMSVYTDQPGLQFYTGNFLAGEFPGKEGAAYGRRTGYCFESQAFPDAVHKENFPTEVLKKGEVYDTVTEYRFYCF